MKDMDTETGKIETILIEAVSVRAGWDVVELI